MKTRTFSFVNVLRKFRHFKLLFIGWSLLVILAASIPRLPQPVISISGENIRLDYAIHFLEFFILSLLFIFLRINNKSKIKPGDIVWYTIGGLSLAFSLEVYQEIIPGRSFNIMDFISSSIGLITGLLFIFLLKKKRLHDRSE